MEVKHPEWLQIQSDNQTLYGYNQEWYKTSFQRTRGCGPTAAAMLLLYLNRRVKEALPYQGHSIPAITKVLEDVWNFVTPGWLLGLNSTNKFCRGTEALLRHYRLAWQCQVLSIPMFRSSRPPLMKVVKFLEEGIASDCPIAFLNLHKGRENALESWHWIVLIALSYDKEQKRYIATCYDGGRLVTFDVAIWLETSKFGGGFVYMKV
ncbi:hypothetical protein [Pelosinus sp. IPA-1]|uniref:hypothetical protein n=1 Tax=Pelosinus sp. IPA-1 TaxID=3029569 RepID=UPI002436212E|nr:hypothetical protein [Pelosinus sp. IPA-1]GMA97681.1 hypothetical protein PIPA1_04810 [Pelosinus sp. IPA-1]